MLVSLARPVFAPRYFMILLPAWIMLAAAGITSKRVLLITAVLSIALASFGIEGVRSYYKADFDIGRNDLRSTTAYILDHAKPGDGIVFYSLSTRFPYDYYAEHSGTAVKPDTLWPGNNAGVGWRDFMGVPAARARSGFR